VQKASGFNMNEKIIYIDNETNLDIDPDRVIKAAIGKLESVAIVGYDKDGKLYMSSSCGDYFEINYLLDKYKQLIMNTEIS